MLLEILRMRRGTALSSSMASENSKNVLGWLSVHRKVCGAVALLLPESLPHPEAPPGAQWQVSRPPA